MFEDVSVDRLMSTATVSIDIEQPASTILRLFASYPIHHLPVLSGQQVIGMLSSADVMKLQAFLPKSASVSEQYLNQHASVATLVRKPVITISAHRLLSEAARLMSSHGIHALPVVDDQQRLLGVLTTTDIIQAALRPPDEAASASRPDGRPEPPDVRQSPAEFDRALAEAKAAIAAGRDAQGVATALLGLQQRLGPLERVLQAADRYLNLGQDPPLVAILRKAITEAKRVVNRDGSEPPAPFGLAGD